MHARRPLLKRVAVWTAAVVLLLVSYVLGAPFVARYCARYVPAAQPAFVVIYAPLVHVAHVPDAPGHESFIAYVEWCNRTCEETF